MNTLLWVGIIIVIIGFFIYAMRTILNFIAQGAADFIAGLFGLYEVKEKKMKKKKRYLIEFTKHGRLYMSYWGGQMDDMVQKWIDSGFTEVSKWTYWLYKLGIKK